jgi:glucose-1-phosphate adenylyltransferase
MHHFLNHDFEYILILSGDQLYQMDFNEMIEKHIESKAQISIATQPVTAKEAPSFGILKSNSDQEITSFIEKPAMDQLEGWNSEVNQSMKDKGREYLASMGIYIFNRDVLIDLMNNPDTVDFGKEIIPNSIHTHKIISYQYPGYWTDIGNIDSFFEANLSLTDDMPEFNLYDKEMRIYTRARMLPTSKISGTSLKKTVISEGCIIHAEKIEHSVIGIRSRIGKASVVTNTYMMGSDRYETLEDVENKHIDIFMGIGENCIINNAIIDKNCRIGDNVEINGGKHLEDQESDMFIVKDGIVVIKKGATIPKGFKL